MYVVQLSVVQQTVALMFAGIALLAPALYAQDAQIEPKVTRAGNLVLESDVPYGQAGNRVLRLDILRPAEKSTKPLPVIVLVHGGG